MTALELDSVMRMFAPDIVALDDVSFAIDQGEFLGIIGPSGSGKSTLLNIMGMLDSPNRGTVIVDGRETRGLSDRELTGIRATSLGFIFQGFHLDDGLTAAENVCTGLLYAGVPRKARSAIAAEALARVGLIDRMHHRPQQLSGGQRQRVAIARAIAKRPALLLADEPTGALDSKNGEQIIELLKSLNDEGVTIAIITHDSALAARLPRTLTLSDGKLVSDVRVPTPALERL